MYFQGRLDCLNRAVRVAVTFTAAVLSGGESRDLDFQKISALCCFVGWVDSGFWYSLRLFSTSALQAGKCFVQ